MNELSSINADKQFDERALRASVQHGIALLDRSGPANWRAHINMVTLNLNSRIMCVLGQLYGHYDSGLRALNLSRHGAAEYGFCCDMDTVYTCVCNELAAIWREALTQLGVPADQRSSLTEQARRVWLIGVSEQRAGEPGAYEPAFIHGVWEGPA